MLKVKEKTIEQMQNGNEAAFNDVYFAYVRIVYYKIYGMTSDYEITEELTQEIFIKVFNQVKSLKDIRKFEPWLFALVSNHVNTYLKNKANRCEFYDDSIIENIESHQSTSIDFDFLKCLSEEESRIISLYFIYGYTMNEIAEIMLTSLNVVKKKYYKSLKKLRKELSKGE